MGLTLWRGPQNEDSDDGAHDVAEHSPHGFANLAAQGLAGLTPDDLADDSLVLALSVSAWIRQAGVGLGAARQVLFSLRRAILASSDLDPVSEPIPLGAGDPVTAVLGLARYLSDMIDRAGGDSWPRRLDVVARALGDLDVPEAAQTG
jgi:hypothetical protein